MTFEGITTYFFTILYLFWNILILTYFFYMVFYYLINVFKQRQ